VKLIIATRGIGKTTKMLSFLARTPNAILIVDNNEKVRNTKMLLRKLCAENHILAETTKEISDRIVNMYDYFQRPHWYLDKEIFVDDLDNVVNSLFGNRISFATMNSESIYGYKENNN
jgi:S-adenosylmethionine:diacylglycerol 3-amino-3-carboxypropyl transferase